MQKIIHFIAIFGLLWCFSACQSLRSKSEERRLAERQTYAEQRTNILCDALVRNAPMDSIRTIAEKDKDLFFYIFNAHQMVYWSTNRLAADEVFLFTYDTWRDKAFANAQTKIRWTKAGLYNVLTVIPLSYTELKD